MAWKLISRWWLQSWSQKMTPWQESYDKPRQCAEEQRHHFANKGPYSQGYGLSIGHDSCESWIIKKAEHPGLVHWEDPEESGGEGGGRGVRDGEYM